VTELVLYSYSQGLTPFLVKFIFNNEKNVC